MKTNKKKKKKDIPSCLSRSSENLYVREGRIGISDSSEMIDWEGRKKILEKRTRKVAKKKGEVEKADEKRNEEIIIQIVPSLLYSLIP